MSDDNHRSIKSDPVEFRATYCADLGPVGMAALHCASFVVVAARLEDDEAAGIMMVLGRPGCDCGCEVPGRAFEYRPTPEHARMLAQDLIRAADAMEATAKRHATALLGRVRKGDGR